MSKIVGIDLGTTRSAVAVMEGGRAKVLPNTEGNNITPSIVSVKDGEIIVGEVAMRQAIVNPNHTIRSIKRIMGTDKKVTIDNKEYTPEQISAMILQKLKRDAENYLGYEVKDAVITVPAYFNDAQRTATKNAGEIAGLNVKRIINEPTAAALAYGLDKGESHVILVFDFGGGTFDVSVLELGEGIFEVKSTSGDNFLGGDDIDDLIINYIAEDFKKQYKIDLREDKTAHQRLKEAAEKAKIELSTSLKAQINLPFISADQTGPRHINMELTRAKFENLISDILKRLEGPTKQALKDAKLQTVDKVILVGGSTRIPSVQKLVKDLLGKEPDKSVHPDEAVAIGAAIQGGILQGDVKDIVLFDVTPLTLGIETLGNIRTPIIERNTTIPTKRSQIFSTAADSQTQVEIHILQGEREMAKDNKSLGRFVLDGIPPAPRGMPQIEVVFDIDANGILNVTAKDKATNKEQKITIQGSTNLKKDEIENMKKDAERHAEEDKKQKEAIETRNTADAVIYNTEKLLQEHKDKIDPKMKEDLENKIKDLKEAVTKDDLQEITKKLEEVQKYAQEVGAKMYEQAAKEQEHAKKEDTKEKDETVVEGDFKEKK